MLTADSTADSARHPIPDSLRLRAEGLARWMKLVGLLQTSAAGIAFAFVSCDAIAGINNGPAVFVEVMMLGMLAMLVRQGLLLQSAAEHLKSLDGDPEDAHDHMKLAFARLRPIFLIDVGIVGLLLLRNSFVSWGVL